MHLRLASLLSVTALVAACRETAPPTRNADGTANGALVFRAYCALCHGPDGRRPAGPRELVLAAVAPQRSEAEVRAIVENGRDVSMPAWRGRLPADELAAVVAHVRSLRAR